LVDPFQLALATTVLPSARRPSAGWSSGSPAHSALYARYDWLSSGRCPASRRHRARQRADAQRGDPVEDPVAGEQAQPHTDQGEQQTDQGAAVLQQDHRQFARDTPGAVTTARVLSSLAMSVAPVASTAASVSAAHTPGGCGVQILGQGRELGII
jgi:hypothetical protein